MVLETDTLLPDTLIFIYLCFFLYPHDLHPNSPTVLFQVDYSGKGVNLPWHET